ncbi:FAD-linked oxidase C-terminal domain-containing protein [soil metagenome]
MKISSQDLAAVVGADHVLTEREDLIPYAFDGTAALKSLPSAVVFPAGSAQVAALLQLAAERGTPIITRGSGTGLSGGSVPSAADSVVLVTTRMNQILEVDAQNLTILTEPGVITKAVDDAAGNHGLFYPPDPGSLKISTIGGNVAENSGGLRGLKYGVTRDYVMGLEVVLPSGTIAWLGNKCVKDVAGYSLKDLFIGSEGTLGVITKILLKLLPIPVAKRTALASFATMEAAAQTVSAIIAAKIIPCTLEFLDQVTIRCVEDFAHVGLPVEAGAILLMETDGHPAAVAEETEAMAAIARSHGALDVRTAADAEEAARLASARRSAFAALARVSPTTILEDVTVPRSHLAEMVAFVNETARAAGLRIGTFGHMGDGNLHPTFLTDETDAAEMTKVHAALDAIVDKTLALGGTITGEHGVGLAKKKYLKQQFDPASYALLAAIKRTIDPHNILNPGKLFDLPDPA